VDGLAAPKLIYSAIGPTATAWLRFVDDSILGSIFELEAEVVNGVGPP